MLSRIAESLFWIGRYVERADDTARILDIYLHQILEDASVEAEACRAMFEVMGRPVPERGPGVSEVLQQLAYDQKAASSISGSLAAARVNARSARDAVSSELWEALNLTYLRMDEQSPPGPTDRAAPVLPMGPGTGRAGRRHHRLDHVAATRAGCSWCWAAASSGST